MNCWLSAVMLVCCAVSAHAAGDALTSAQPFTGMDGTPHTLAELHGHPAVVNFWATWCGPCRAEMPRLQKLSEAYAGKGVIFVAISIDDAETQGKIPAALAKSGLRFSAWKGATAATLKQLDLGLLVPATLILDSDGAVIGKIEGEARDKDIQSRLDWLLNGRQTKQPKLVQKNDW